MIKTEAEYRRAVQDLAGQRERLQQQGARLQGQGLSDDQVQVAMEPLWAFHTQLADEIGQYERTLRGDFDVLRNLDGVGELITALRVHLGLSQAQLAERLAVDPSVVCRDERNEYHGITLERAAKILSVMGVELRISVEVPESSPATRSSKPRTGNAPPIVSRRKPALSSRSRK